ncbi:MAG: nitrilase-related carbon-nitrogen hydrolase [Nostocaceae cyanobacterium]|nr:nitrilase-related carbon-nitrogen hydrolase [Nostocaceae cyanobacterium]
MNDIYRPKDRLSWLWLAVGAILLPLTIFWKTIPIAAWLTPVFILRFTRTAKQPLMALLAVMLVHSLVYIIAIYTEGFIWSRSVFLALCLAIAHTLSYLIDRLLIRYLSPMLGTLVFPLTATTIDWLLGVFSPRTSFASLAYNQAGNLPLQQIVAITGIWGLTFLITCFASVINAIWHVETLQVLHKKTSHLHKRAVRKTALLFGSLLLLVLLFGGGRLALFPPTSPTVRVAAIVPDRKLWNSTTEGIPMQKLGQFSEQEWDTIRNRAAPVLDDLFARTQQEARAGSKIIAWTEDAAPILKEDETNVIERAATMAQREDIYLQIAIAPLLRTDKFPFMQNRAVMFAPSGKVVWEYDKTHPIPLKESRLFAPGRGIVPIVQTPYGRIATVIGDDADFPNLVRQAGQMHADLLLVPANDDKNIKLSHPQTATFRAIENGVNILRPTINGDSLAIDYQGRVLGMTDSFGSTQPVMVASVPTRGVNTIYTHTSDRFVYLGVAGLLAIIALAMKGSRLRGLRFFDY